MRMFYLIILPTLQILNTRNMNEFQIIPGISSGSHHDIKRRSIQSTEHVRLAHVTGAQLA